MRMPQDIGDGFADDAKQVNALEFCQGSLGFLLKSENPVRYPRDVAFKKRACCSFQPEDVKRLWMKVIDNVPYACGNVFHLSSKWSQLVSLFGNGQFFSGFQCAGNRRQVGKCLVMKVHSDSLTFVFYPLQEFLHRDDVEEALSHIGDTICQFIKFISDSRGCVDWY